MIFQSSSFQSLLKKWLEAISILSDNKSLQAKFLFKEKLKYCLGKSWLMHNEKTSAYFTSPKSAA